MTKKILPEAMRTNITFIDEEHSALIGICEELIGVAVQGGVERLKELLDYLRRYTETHFHNEEQYMTEHGYAGFDLHKKEHDFFMNMMETSAKELQQGSSRERTLTEIMESMKDWIVDHINEIDLNMTTALNK